MHTQSMLSKFFKLVDCILSVKKCLNRSYLSKVISIPNYEIEYVTSPLVQERSTLEERPG